MQRNFIVKVKGANRKNVADALKSADITVVSVTEVYKEEEPKPEQEDQNETKS